MSDDEKKAFHARIISMERIENEYLIVEINERGAELIRIFSKKNGVEYLWDGDPAYWKKHSPVLFPFIGRMKDQKYTYRGRTFDAEKHGFVSVTDFSVEDKGADHVVFSFSGEDKSYPFPLTFKMIYRLDENRLEMSAYIENGSDRPMPYAIGFHPGFKIPLSAGLQFEDYYLWFPDAGNVMRAVFSSVFFIPGISGFFNIFRRYSPDTKKRRAISSFLIYSFSVSRICNDIPNAAAIRTSSSRDGL